MRLVQTAVVGVCVLVLVLSSSVSLATGVASSSGTGVSASARSTFDLSSTFLSSSLSNPQLSPYYCFPFICYTPQDLRAAYDYPNYLNGAGQTIVIIDAFGGPAGSAQAELNVFDSAFNLPPTRIQVVCQGFVCPTFNTSDPDQVGWTGEIALDVEYAHAMAPGAHIVLFVARSDDDLTLEQAALQAVVMFPHSIISQSWGDPELDMIDHTCFYTTDNPSGDCNAKYVLETLATGELAYQLAALEGTTVFAAAGDWGADNSPICNGYYPYCPYFTSANPIYPASSPWVTAVGGTEGNPYYFDAIPSCDGARTCSTGLVNFLNTAACQLNTETPTATASCIPVGYSGEQVWNEGQFDAATGGAPSLIFGTPFYQAGLGLTSRGMPDVSYDASISGGVIIYDSAVTTGPFGSPAGFYFTGGTSCGSPQWAAIAALADQLASELHRGPIGFLNPALYSIGNDPRLYQRDFHDITVGNNILPDGFDVGFNAGPGWDDASGWGTPNVANLVPDLVFLS